MNKIKISLLGKIAIAIIIGIFTGIVMPEWAGRIFATMSDIFSNFLGFAIPLIIIALVAPAIGQLGSGSGKTLLLTIAIAYISTIAVGIFTYFTCNSFFPTMLSGAITMQTNEITDFYSPYFTINMPPVMSVMSALLLAFTIGIGLSAIKGNALRTTLDDFSTIIIKLIGKVIIPVLPYYIYCIFMEMSASGQAMNIISVFSKVIIIIFILHILVLLIQFCIAGAIGHKNPLILLKNMLPAYFTALGTSSSAATIPVTLNQTIKNGVSEPVARFVVPLCATIHMSGSMLKITACAMAIMIITGTSYDFSLFSAFIFTLGVTAVAAPGIPGGVIMASLGILQSILGFDQTACALMIALYVAMDSFGTACNVTGDGAIAVIIDRYSKNKITLSGNE